MGKEVCLVRERRESGLNTDGLDAILFQTKGAVCLRTAAGTLTVGREERDRNRDANRKINKVR